VLGRRGPRELTLLIRIEATSTNGSGTTQQSTIQSSLSTPSSTQDLNTVQIGSLSSSSSSLTLDEKIGLIIGLLGLAGTLVGAYFARRPVIAIIKSVSPV
jgi:hypothetical protein